MPAMLSHEQILEEALAALTEDDIPADDADRAWADADTGRPVEFAGLSGAELDELLAAAVPASSPWRTEPSWPVPASAGAASPGAVSAGAAPAGAASAGAASAGAARAGEELPGGWLPRGGSGAGSGFADGGELDMLAAGLPLAGFAEDTHRALTQVSDDVLVGGAAGVAAGLLLGGSA